jgi:small subunit ribosomal protein S6
MAATANTQFPLPGYETTFITKTEISDEMLKTLCEKIVGIIKDFKGEVIAQEDWGKKKLAYSIEKESRGHYTHLVYTGEGAVVAEIERNLRLNENVVRFLTIRVAAEFNEENYKKHKEAMVQATKKRDEEREARREARESRDGSREDYREHRRRAPVAAEADSE